MILGREDWKGIEGEIIFSNLDICIYFAKIFIDFVVRFQEV